MIFLPEITITFFMIFTLLMGVFQPVGKRGLFSFVMTVIALLIITTQLIIYPIHVEQWQGWQYDQLSQSLKLLISGLTLFIMVFSYQYLVQSKIKLFEYGILLQAVLLGVFVVCSANNFLILFIGLELSALPLYAMIALFHQRLGLEAAIKYFVLGALASGFILFGISLSFGASGSIDFVMLDTKLSLLGGLLITCGLLFKLGCAPFHTWVPDVYQGAPYPIITVIATLPKFAYIVAFIRLGQHGFYNGSLQYVLMFCALLSMAIGNLSALSQDNLKRLLGYSSIAHMGYLVLAIAVGQTGYAASIFYVSLYALATAGCLCTLMLYSKANHEINMINQLAHLHAQNPFIALILMVIFFSMAAIPPLGGFIAKLNVFYALYQAKFITVGIIAMLFAVFGIFYYIRLVRLMYFNDSINALKSNLASQTLSLEHYVLAIPVVLILINGMIPNYFMQHSAELLPESIKLTAHQSGPKSNHHVSMTKHHTTFIT